MVNPALVVATENAVFGFPSWTDQVTFAGGSWNTSYPATRLGTLPLSKIARSESAALSSTQFTGVFSKTYPVRLLAFVRHTMSISAQFRLTLYSDTGLTTAIYAGDWEDVWPVVYEPGDLEWEDEAWWDGRYSTLERANTIWTRPIWLDRVYSVGSFRVEISDPLNSAGYVTIGRFEVSMGWQVSIDLAFPTSYGYQMRTVVEAARGGTEYFERLSAPRVVQGAIEYMPRDEAMIRGFEWHRQHDRDRPFLYLPHPEQQKHWLRTAFLARHDDPGLFAYVNVQRQRVPVGLKEVL